MGSGHNPGDAPLGAEPQDAAGCDHCYNWELYKVHDDPTLSNDLASLMPDKVKQMEDLFYTEAKKYNLLPLDNTTLARWKTSASEPHGRANPVQLFGRADRHAEQRGA
jgi:hypothetical protein